jgi:hypothetical protein
MRILTAPQAPPSTPPDVGCDKRCYKSSLAVTDTKCSYTRYLAVTDTNLMKLAPDLMKLAPDLMKLGEIWHMACSWPTMGVHFGR